MDTGTENIGPIDNVQIGIRIVFSDFIQNIVYSNHTDLIGLGPNHPFFAGAAAANTRPIFLSILERYASDGDIQFIFDLAFALVR